jgi:signal transduction histidine kinase/DNA-binding response OmpR family regulator
MAQSMAKILVMDDEKGIRDLLKGELTKKGYSVDTAENGREGITKATSVRYDVIISDIKMPGYDGLKALGEIKKFSPETEVIMITGFATVENAVEAMRLGAYDFVQKPFNLEEMALIIARAIERSELKTLVALYDSSKAIFSTFKLEEIFPIMINLVKKVVSADEVALLLFDNESQLYLAAATFSLVSYHLRNDFLTLSERLSGSSQINNSPVIIDFPFDKHPFMEKVFSDSDLASIIVYPMILKDKNLGSLVLARNKGHTNFNISDSKNLSIFVSQIAQAIYNTKLYDKLSIKIEELENAYSKTDKLERQLELAEKSAMIGKMVVSIVHFLKNSLSGLKTNLSGVINDPNLLPPTRKSFAQMDEIVNHCDGLISNLLFLGAPVKTSEEQINVNNLIKDVLASLQRDAEKSKIIFRENLASDLPPLKMDKNYMGLALLNILMNSLESGPSSITVKTSANRDEISVEITDDGAGVEPGLLDKILDPFFTGKDPKKNIGLGLSIANAIIKQANGKIHIMSNPKEGTSVLISFPV